MELEDIYKLYVNDLYRYLFSLSKDHFISEDLVQEVFYRSYLILDDYEIKHIKAWLFKVAYNAFIDYQRKNKRIVVGNEVSENIEGNMGTPEKRVLEKESFTLLLEDLNTLNENEKQAVLLCDLHGFHYQEASDILDVKLNTFKSYLSRGRRRVMKRVKERMRKDDR
ncbi:sigma-70 family RNA polymerase sigma factor [Mesobacillus foraminis]|uniref:sigma-70 family RNA polymerase sigma factor n=1 Tax=Mesobacillus foraminis TaxID=279826 RepID=UPI001BEC1E37|nr:sigma-70 family RNA polymerase sigma factor [Mesobacillus foraminis]MBT2757932.1 sigma-70 family RNA polymerase sigma factor [Mesobacillus foraminis]